MSEITTTVERDSDGVPYVAVRPAVTLDDLANKLDALGKQMDWLVENLASLFMFVNQMGQNGGGIRGLMKTLKQQDGPEFNTTPGGNSE